MLISNNSRVRKNYFLNNCFLNNYIKSDASVISGVTPSGSLMLSENKQELLEDKEPI